MSDKMTPTLPATESGVQAACAEYLLWQGFLVVRINSGAARPERKDGSAGFIPFNWWQHLNCDRRVAGLSDLLAFRADRKPMAIECKRAPGIEPTPEQVAFLAAWREAGGISIVASGVSDLQRIVEGV